MAASTTEGKPQEWAERLQASNNRPKLTADALAANDNKQLSNDCADAEPYIPTYLAALKKPVKTVTLDGVPLRHNAHQLNSNTFEESTTNTGNHCGVTAERSEDVTNRSSCSDEDVEWADDDDAFIQQVNKCKAQRKSLDDQKQYGSYSATTKGTNCNNNTNYNNNYVNDGSKRRNNRKPKRGWQKVEETNTRTNQSNEGGRFAKRSTNNKNNNNNNNSKGKEGNSTPSGGRFDVLSRANWGQK